MIVVNPYRSPFFDMDYHDDVEEAQEASVNSENASTKDKRDEKLLDIENEAKDPLLGLEATADSSRNGIAHDASDAENGKSLEEFFGNLILEKKICDTSGQSLGKTEQNNSELGKSSEERKLAMDIFGECNTDFDLADLSSVTLDTQQQQPLNLLASESAALLDEILNDKQQQCANNDWESISGDTFLPPNILKQSLGDAALGMGQRGMAATNHTDDKVSTDRMRG